MLYDDVLHHVGDFGLYQKLVLSLVSICILVAPMNVVSQVFSLGTPTIGVMYQNGRIAAALRTRIIRRLIALR